MACRLQISEQLREAKVRSVIKVAVFDFDGTLVDSNAIKREGFFRLAARYPNGEAAMAEVIGTCGDRRSVLSAFSAWMASAGVHLNVDELVVRYCEHVDPAVAAAPEMRGATNLLVKLRHAGLRLHLNSATPAESLLTILDTRGWTVRFNGIHSAATGKVEALQKIGDAEHARGEEIVVVGDGIDDAYAAKLIGAQFVAVGSGSYAAANPDVRVLPLHKVAAHVLALRCC